MISLINGHIQNPQSANIVPLGSMELTLNVDATVIASPFGQVMAGVTVRLYFDASCNVIATGGVNQIWSNFELNPQQSPSLLGTWYTVNFYDQNNARVNLNPLTWIFTQTQGSTVDIGTMTATNVPGIVYYPVLGGGGGGGNVADSVFSMVASGTIPALATGQNSFGKLTGGLFGIVVALPSAVGVSGQSIKVIKIDGTPGFGACDVTGALTGDWILSNQYQYAMFESDNVGWWLVGNN